MTDLSDTTLLEAVARQESLVRDTVSFIHDHPELPHEEHRSSQYLVEVLRSRGLDVELGLAGMATGFRATLTGASPGKTVGIVALYDAVASVPPEGASKLCTRAATAPSPVASSAPWRHSPSSATSSAAR
jgi:metal-dependent amidase/aminoacylase/carboxypeptidase family protein